MSPQTDHPVDALPDYARGVAADAESIALHLETCESCRSDLEILRALQSSAPEPLTDLERQRAYRRFERARVGGSGGAGGGRGSRPWLSVTWRAAAAVALVLTSVGLWRIARTPVPATDWSPELAIQGWEEDLAELDVDPMEIRLAFGTSVEEPSWYEAQGLDPYDVATPWEDR